MARFLRTLSTRRLLAGVTGIIVFGATCAAVAVAAVGSGPIAPVAPLANALHTALSGKPVTAMSADVTFTNNLFTGSSLGVSDPLINGATGRMWATAGQLRIELQSSNGDSQIVVHGTRFWVYDPSSNTVYEGTLPQSQTSDGANGSSAIGGSSGAAVPTVAQIQAGLKRMSKQVTVSTPTPTDIGGQPAYSLTLTPRSKTGLLDAVRLGFDANHAVPLDFALLARGASTPALELRASNVSYGAVSPAVFAISPPAGAHVVTLSFTSAKSSSTGPLASGTGKPELVGKGLGSIVVVKHAASAAHSGSGLAGGLPLQSVKINGVTGRQIPTSLGTILTFTRNGTSYLLAGSVTAARIDAVARGL
ncbi:MAG: LolA family protein [Solirubrobacteraceae bacterium]